MGPSRRLWQRQSITDGPISLALGKDWSTRPLSLCLHECSSDADLQSVTVSRMLKRNLHCNYSLIIQYQLIKASSFSVTLVFKNTAIILTFLCTNSASTTIHISTCTHDHSCNFIYFYSFGVLYRYTSLIKDHVSILLVVKKVKYETNKF